MYLDNDTSKTYSLTKAIRNVGGLWNVDITNDLD